MLITAERFLPTHLDPVLVVCDCIGGNRGMVARVCQYSDGLERPLLCRCDEPNLLTDQLGLSHVGISIPLANEKFSQERIKWFLLASQLFTATAVLLAERGEEPSENG